jgi:hypothetical protein
VRSAGNIFRGLISIFKKKKIIFTGRCGMTFSDEGITYFIDSELHAGKNDVAIFDREIYYLHNNSKIVLSENEAYQILNKVEKEMGNIGLVVEMPDQYIRKRDLVRKQ